MSHRRLLLGAAWLGAFCPGLLTVGCAADRASPGKVLRQYAAALDAGRTQDAYALLSRETRQELPYAAFARQVQENPREMRELAAALQRPVEKSYITANVAGPDGETLLLVYEDGAWRIDGSAIDLYSQATPPAALHSFIRAFEVGRYDLLMRFVPDAKRAGLDAKKLRAAWEGDQKQEMQQLVQSLKGSFSTLSVEQLGDRATLGYGSGATVELVREQGLWKIEEF